MKSEIERIIGELNTLKDRGRKVIKIDLIRDVLVNIAKDTPDAPDTKKEMDTLVYKLNHEGKMAEYRETNEVNRVLINAAITFAGGALRVITLMNGGAAVACLAYAGNVKDKVLLPAMLFFTYGMLMGAIAHGSTYMAQLNFCNSNDDGDRCNKAGNVFQFISIFLVLASYVFFISGSLSGYYGLNGK